MNDRAIRDAYFIALAAGEDWIYIPKVITDYSDSDLKNIYANSKNEFKLGDNVYRKSDYNTVLDFVYAVNYYKYDISKIIPEPPKPQDIISAYNRGETIYLNVPITGTSEADIKKYYLKLKQNGNDIITWSNGIYLKLMDLYQSALNAYNSTTAPLSTDSNELSLSDITSEAELESIGYFKNKFDYDINYLKNPEVSPELNTINTINPELQRMKYLSDFYTKEGTPRYNLYSNPGDGPVNIYRYVDVNDPDNIILSMDVPKEREVYLYQDENDEYFVSKTLLKTDTEPQEIIPPIKTLPFGNTVAVVTKKYTYIDIFNSSSLKSGYTKPSITQTVIAQSDKYTYFDKNLNKIIQSDTLPNLEDTFATSNNIAQEYIKKRSFDETGLKDLYSKCMISIPLYKKTVDGDKTILTKIIDEEEQEPIKVYVYKKGINGNISISDEEEQINYIANDNQIYCLEYNPTTVLRVETIGSDKYYIYIALDGDGVPTIQKTLEKPNLYDIIFCYFDGENYKFCGLVDDITTEDITYDNTLTDEFNKYLTNEILYDDTDYYYDPYFSVDSGYITQIEDIVTQDQIVSIKINETDWYIFIDEGYIISNALPTSNYSRDIEGWLSMPQSMKVEICFTNATAVVRLYVNAGN